MSVPITKDNAQMAWALAIVFMALCAAMTLWQGFRYETEREQFIDCIVIGHMDPQTCKDVMGM